MFSLQWNVRRHILYTTLTHTDTHTHTHTRTTLLLQPRTVRLLLDAGLDSRALRVKVGRASVSFFDTAASIRVLRVYHANIDHMEIWAGHGGAGIWDGQYRGRLLNNTGGLPNNTRILG